MPKQPGEGWTPERIALAKRLWLEGQSCAQIARRIRNGFTRHSVSGKLDRLGLFKSEHRWTPAPPTTSDRRKHNRPVSSPPPLAREFGTAGAPKAKPRSPTMPKERPPLDDTVVPLFELKHHHCRWPIGDPQSPSFGFCGRHKDGERPYCADHAKVAFQPAQKKKAEPEPRHRRAA